jgi:hypothetical protein
MILYNLGAFPNGLLLLRFQNFQASHPSPLVTLIYNSGTNYASGKFYRIPNTLSRTSPPASTPSGEIATSAN